MVNCEKKSLLFVSRVPRGDAIDFFCFMLIETPSLFAIRHPHCTPDKTLYSKTNEKNRNVNGTDNRGDAFNMFLRDWPINRKNTRNT